MQYLSGTPLHWSEAGLLETGSAAGVDGWLLQAVRKTTNSKKLNLKDIS